MLFSLVYGTDALILVEIDEPTLQANFDLIDEVRECSRLNGEALKRRVEMRYKSKVIPRQFKVSNLVMWSS